MAKKLLRLLCEWIATMISRFPMGRKKEEVSTPSVTGGGQIDSGGTGTIRISGSVSTWGKPVTYEIYNYSGIASISPTSGIAENGTVSFTVNILSSSGTYRIYVRAKSASGVYSSGRTVSGTIYAAPPTGLLSIYLYTSLGTRDLLKVPDGTTFMLCYVLGTRGGYVVGGISIEDGKTLEINVNDNTSVSIVKVSLLGNPEREKLFQPPYPYVGGGFIHPNAIQGSSMHEGEPGTFSSMLPDQLKSHSYGILIKFYATPVDINGN